MRAVTRNVSLYHRFSLSRVSVQQRRKGARFLAVRRVLHNFYQVIGRKHRGYYRGFRQVMGLRPYNLCASSHVNYHVKFIGHVLYGVRRKVMGAIYHFLVGTIYRTTPSTTL